MVPAAGWLVPDVPLDLEVVDFEVGAGRVGRRPARQLPERDRRPAAEVREGRPVRRGVPRLRSAEGHGRHRGARRRGLRLVEALHRGPLDVQGHFHGPLPGARVPREQGPPPSESSSLRLRRDAHARHIHAGGQALLQRHRRDVRQRRVDQGVPHRVQLRNPLGRGQQGREDAAHAAGLDRAGRRSRCSSRLPAAEAPRLVQEHPGEVCQGHVEKEDLGRADKARAWRRRGVQHVEARGPRGVLQRHLDLPCAEECAQRIVQGGKALEELLAPHRRSARAQGGRAPRGGPEAQRLVPPTQVPGRRFALPGARRAAPRGHRSRRRRPRELPEQLRGAS
mmetsp:Transcript_24276/g.70235  ORF Transcript_24276/g.70235 Transcript_24276/m.70235 type:complete len:337 (+) Transcript_24276:216-1226(+)